MSKNLIPISIIVAGLIIGGAFIYVNQSKGLEQGLSPQEIAEKAINYLNENVLAEGNTASLIDVTEEGDVYKIHLKIGEREYDSYVTPDGRFLFPEGYDLEAETETEKDEEEPSDQAQEQEEEEEFSDAQLEALAKCLSEKGAKFYGTYGCGWCARQKEIFGEAAKYLPYIECADEKTRYLCEEAEIGPVPTWDFPDGKRVSGLQSLGKLAELSGCSF